MVKYVEDDLKCDARRARLLLQQLRDTGRTGHPAAPHLEALAGPEPSRTLFVAAVAFDAGVRLHFGELAGQAARHTGHHERLTPFLRNRPANAWEAHPDIAFTEVDWGALLRWSRDAICEGSIAIDPAIPGASCLAQALTVTTRRNPARSELFAHLRSFDVLNPVTATGLFLADALPGYTDLDECLRAHRMSTAAEH